MSSERILNTMIQKGSKVSITIEIVDQEKANRLLDTMYDKYVDEFGVKVHLWGNCDLIKADEIRHGKLNELKERFQSEFDRIINERSFDLIESDKNNLF
jgi:hypothetical protein